MRRDTQRGVVWLSTWFFFEAHKNNISIEEKSQKTSNFSFQSNALTSKSVVDMSELVEQKPVDDKRDHDVDKLKQNRNTNVFFRSSSSLLHIT